MRWDRFFEDLEDQLASEWEAERAALDTEAERLRLSRVLLQDRLSGLLARDGHMPHCTLELIDGTALRATVTGVGADCAVVLPTDGRARAFVVPFAAISSIGVTHQDLLLATRPPDRRTGLADRLTFGFVLRDLVRRRAGVSVHLSTGRALTGTIDRAGADHLDLALHDAGAPRRAGEVTGYRIISFSAVAWVRVDGSAPVL